MTDDLEQLAERVDRFRLRVVQDALTQALGEHWLRRAEAFENARPRPEDFTGRATPDEYDARDDRLAQIAAMCRHRAALAIELADHEFPLGMLRAMAATGHSRRAGAA